MPASRRHEGNAGDLRKLINGVSESFSSAWRLLSDTTNYLSRVKLLEEYEQDLKGWRDRLYHSRNDSAAAREVREAVVALRRALRLQGYDIRLGSKDLVLEGFRNDDAIAGDSNHNELADYLEQQLRARRKLKPYRPHYLWYRWRDNVLIMSGAASETEEQFEELKKYVPDRKELLLRKLKDI